MINFVIVAAVVYFLIVVPMNKIIARGVKEVATPATPALPEDIALLREIRDLLKK